MRRFARTISKITEETRKRWDKGQEKIRRKCEWLQQKIRKPLQKVEIDTEEDWIRRLAQGRGKARKRIKIQIPVYGGVTLDDNERDALSLPPKFAQYEKLRMTKIKHQQFIRNSKLRFSMRDRDYNEKGEDVTPPEEPLSMEQQVKEQEYREVYNKDTKTLDFRKLRPTDVKSNPRVCLPTPGPPKQEAEIQVRDEVEERVILEDLDEFRREDNLTDSESKGLEKLKARVKS